MKGDRERGKSRANPPKPSIWANQNRNSRASRNWVVLHGIASYSSNGLYVYENVLKHMDWITSTVNEN